MTKHNICIYCLQEYDDMTKLLIHIEQYHKAVKDMERIYDKVCEDCVRVG